MIQLIRKMVALPFQMACTILSVIPIVSVPEWLVGTIWRIDPSSANALRYLYVAQTQQNPEQVLALAESIFDMDPSGELAAYIGLLALQYGQIDKALACYETSLSFDQTEIELPLHLAIALSPYSDKINDVDLAHKILDRRDVSMSLSRSALDTLAINALINNQWSEAESYIQRIFQVEDAPQQRWMRWVLAAGQGRTQAAEAFYEQAWQGLEPAQAAVNKTYGWSILGDHDKARETLQDALQAGISSNALLALCKQLSIEPPQPTLDAEEVD